MTGGLVMYIYTYIGKKQTDDLVYLDASHGVSSSGVISYQDNVKKM